MDTGAVIRRVQNLFGDNDEIIITKPMIVDWINEGQVEITRETLHKDAVVTPTASSFISGYTPTALLSLNRVVYGSTPLALVQVETIDRMAVYNAQEGTPNAYYSIGDKVYLYPPPAASDTTVVSVYYSTMPTDLADEVAALDLPARYHNDLVAFCVAKSHEQNENFSAARYYMEKFRTNLALNIHQTENQDDSFHVKQPDIMAHDGPEYDRNW